MPCITSVSPHPDLDFHVDVTVHERDGRFMATADLGEDSWTWGVGDTAQEAVRAALQALGEPYASEMAARVITAEWRLLLGGGQELEGEDPLLGRAHTDH